MHYRALRVASNERKIKHAIPGCPRPLFMRQEIWFYEDVFDA